jgi:Family of unknown function (DUF6518)
VVPRDVLRKSAVVVGAVAFGAVVSVVKGNGAGLRDAIGNISAPWLILPFAAALCWRVRSPLRGALVGLGASLLALIGFYCANSIVLELGPHGWGDDLRLAVSAGRLYFALAIVSGPCFGFLGAWWNRTPSRWAAILIAALLVFEPLVTWLYGVLAVHHASSGLALVWFGEIILGLCACAAVALTPRPSRRRGSRPGPEASAG